MFDPHRGTSVFCFSVNELALVVFPNNLGVAEGVADGVAEGVAAFFTIRV